MEGDLRPGHPNEDIDEIGVSDQLAREQRNWQRQAEDDRLKRQYFDRGRVRGFNEGVKAGLWGGGFLTLVVVMAFWVFS